MGSVASICFRDCSPLHTFGSAVSHKLILFVMGILSSRCSKSFEKDTKETAKVQSLVRVFGLYCEING